MKCPNCGKEVGPSRFIYLSNPETHFPGRAKAIAEHPSFKGSHVSSAFEPCEEVK